MPRLYARVSVIGGSATVGLKVETPNSEWTGVDNFKLEYLGRSWCHDDAGLSKGAHC